MARVIHRGPTPQGPNPFIDLLGLAGAGLGGFLRGRAKRREAEQEQQRIDILKRDADRLQAIEDRKAREAKSDADFLAARSERFIAGSEKMTKRLLRKQAEGKALSAIEQFFIEFGPIVAGNTAARLKPGEVEDFFEPSTDVVAPGGTQVTKTGEVLHKAPPTPPKVTRTNLGLRKNPDGTQTAIVFNNTTTETTEVPMGINMDQFVTAQGATPEGDPTIEVFSKLNPSVRLGSTGSLGLLAKPTLTQDELPDGRKANVVIDLADPTKRKVVNVFGARTLTIKTVGNTLLALDTKGDEVSRITIASKEATRFSNVELMAAFEFAIRLPDQPLPSKTNPVVKQFVEQVKKQPNSQRVLADMLQSFQEDMVISLDKDGTLTMIKGSVAGAEQKLVLRSQAKAREASQQTTAAVSSMAEIRRIARTSEEASGTLRRKIAINFAGVLGQFVPDVAKELRELVLGTDFQDAVALESLGRFVQGRVIKQLSGGDSRFNKFEQQLAKDYIQVLNLSADQRNIVAAMDSAIDTFMIMREVQLLVGGLRSRDLADPARKTKLTRDLRRMGHSDAQITALAERMTLELSLILDTLPTER